MSWLNNLWIPYHIAGISCIIGMLGDWKWLWIPGACVLGAFSIGLIIFMIASFILAIFDIRYSKEERSIEYYRDRHHVAVFGFFEDGALINWAILWGTKSFSGRFPRKRK